MASARDMSGICADLAAEHADLDELVAGLDEAGWDTVTPAEGWAVRDQISHLAFFDGTATLSATDPEAFAASLSEVASDGDAYMRRHLDRGRSMSGAELLGWWRTGRAELLAALAPLDPAARLAWYGPPMSALSFATARLMETWAHGQDVADGLGRQRRPTDRLRHVCHIGVRAMPFSYTVRGLAVPEEGVLVELEAPSGEVWTWGPDDAADRVRGSALDFALVVTQRRHRADTGLVAEGPVADEWLSIAQAFAGPPGPGRQPGQFAAAGGAGAPAVAEEAGVGAPAGPDSTATGSGGRS
ncbi:MAG TPA: TIGR03084 family metal-binding protein [Acidimicrobiales bacterium]|nr:TIGR03084 family metal-binding protein [Acidimicrobiales bacterium]